MRRVLRRLPRAPTSASHESGVVRQPSQFNRTSISDLAAEPAQAESRIAATDAPSWPLRQQRSKLGHRPLAADAFAAYHDALDLPIARVLADADASSLRAVTDAAAPYESLRA